MTYTFLLDSSAAINAEMKKIVPIIMFLNFVFIANSKIYI
jgi:hypothetical protein